jgi:hypothetical protein
VHPLVIPEEIENFGVAAQAQRPQQHRHRHFAVFINTNIENIGKIGFIFQPRAAVGDHRRGEQLFAGGIVAHAIVHAGRTHQLGYNDTLGTVDNKGAAFGHEREIAHKHFGFLDLAGLFIDKTSTDTQRRRIGDVPHLAFLHGIFRIFVQTIIHELQYQIAGVVGDRGRIVEYLFQPFFQEPLVRVFLNFDEVGHFQDLIDLRKAHTGVVSQFYRFNVHHPRSLLFPKFHSPPYQKRGFGRSAKSLQNPLAICGVMCYDVTRIGIEPHCAIQEFIIP